MLQAAKVGLRVIGIGRAGAIAWVGRAYRFVVLVKVGTFYWAPVDVVACLSTSVGQRLRVVGTARAVVTNIANAFAIYIVITGDFRGDRAWVLIGFGSVGNAVSGTSDFIF